MHFSSRFKNHVKFVFKSIFIPLMCNSALWVCLSLEDSWPSPGHYRQSLFYSELRNKIQKTKTEINKTHTVLLVGIPKYSLIHSKVNILFFVNTFQDKREQREYSSGKKLSNATSITCRTFSLYI